MGPPSDFWDIFEFGTFLKNVDPPPLLPNWDIFEFRRFFIKAILQNIAKIIEIGTFLKNRDPPLCFQNSQIEIGTFLFLGCLYLVGIVSVCAKFQLSSWSRSGQAN